MSVVQTLAVLATRELLSGACDAVGFKVGGHATEMVANFLAARFTDESQRLTKAIQAANENAWKTFEIALAGESFWDRCKAMLARSEDRAFAQQVRAFLDANSLPELAGKTNFRQKCLEELRAARKAGSLTIGKLNPKQLAQETGALARFGDPQSLLDGEWQLIQGIAAELKEEGYSSLAWLLSQRPENGMPLLVVGVRYFFRRGVEDDPKLFQGLAFAKLERLDEAQQKGFAALSAALLQKGESIEELLGDVKTVVVQTHSAVLDLQGQIKGQAVHIQQISQAVMKLLEQHQLQRRELRPTDSLSIRNDSERQIVKQVVARYRSLPENEKRQTPALLNAIGKLEVVAGNFDAAQKDFQHVATLVEDTAAKAEAHHNAYHAALERRDRPTALKELLDAIKLEGKRYAPFPVGKYYPHRILGDGGFGVAFLCRHTELKADVVVKTLPNDDLGRDVDDVLNEARVLFQLDHPSIIRLLDCGYTIPTEKARPYIVMSFFDGVTLDEYVQKNGPLSPEDLIAVACQIAEGLQAAHSKNILHRDVKPANILVLKDDSGWKVKIIDFGLALKQELIANTASTNRQSKTIMGSSIAGTLDYAAPEQMGRQNEAIGPYSDIYGFAKTCSFSLFQTTQPLFKHWQSLPLPLAKLLETCLEEDPKKRPQTLTAVLKNLNSLRVLPVVRVAVLVDEPTAVQSGMRHSQHSGVDLVEVSDRLGESQFRSSDTPFSFKGEASVNLTTAEALPKVREIVENTLQRLGKVSINRQGSITVSPKSMFSSFLTSTTIKGEFEPGRKPNEYTVTLSYCCAPSSVNWLIAILGTLFFCVGFLTLFIPLTNKSTLSTEVSKTLTELEDSFKAP